MPGRDKQFKKDSPETQPEPESSEGGDRGDSATPKTIISSTTGAPGSTSPVPKRTTVAQRKEEYLLSNIPARVGNAAPQNVAPFDLSLFDMQFSLPDSDIELVRRLPKLGTLTAMSVGQHPAHDIMVVRMSSTKAEEIKGLYREKGVTIERDSPLIPEQIVPPPVAIRDPGVIVPLAAGVSFVFMVVGKDGAPVAGANVYVFGNLFPGQGVTDASGQAQVDIQGESAGTIKAVYVKPRADYWSYYLARPQLDPTQINVVTMSRLNEHPSLYNFPVQEVILWGHRAMKVDQLPDNFRGKGIKVGVIDSGAALTHRDLQAQIRGGYDTIERSDTAWSQDKIGHGSHCAGIIAGAANGTGIRGVAPDAEIFPVRIFPDGKFSNLIEALDKCMEKGVDVINMSLGSGERSALLEQKIQQAKQLGIPCIVAAGNSGGPVQFPASSASVLAVAAIGKKGEYPEGSYHATTVFTRDGVEFVDNSFFSAKFTCFGPEIGVCAPGVAIVSSVPDDNFAAWDGTSMAAPYVTGLAALILAHHPDFQGQYKTKNAQRVERLFQILKESAQPLNLGDPYRTGAGLPDALKALRTQPALPQVSGLSPSDLEKIIAAIRSAWSPGNGAGQSGSRAAVANNEALQRLSEAVRRLGVAESGGATSAQTDIYSRGTASSERDYAIRTLQQLRETMAKAGIAEEVSNTKPQTSAYGQTQASPTAPSSSAVNEPNNVLQQLRGAMKKAGLLG